MFQDLFCFRLFFQCLLDKMIMIENDDVVGLTLYVNKWDRAIILSELGEAADEHKYDSMCSRHPSFSLFPLLLFFLN